MSKPSKLPPLERYIRILELLSAFPNGLSLTEVATIVELPKASAHRLLKTMQELELISLVANGTPNYIAGVRLRRLALSSLDHNWIEVLARPFLRELTNETGETAFIAKIAGDVVYSIVMEAPDTPLRGYISPGSIMPIHAAASAKAIFAFQNEDTVSKALNKPYKKYTSKTITNKEDLIKEFAHVRETGYSSCIGELDKDLVAYAVPIALRGVKGFYSLGITGPLRRVQSKGQDQIVSAMKGYAERISSALMVGLEHENAEYIK